MSDIKTTFSNDYFSGDWVIDKGDLVSGDDLETAIYISLFTDRRAHSDDQLDSNDQRGWWGDGGYLIGSRLWLLYRQKLTDLIAKRAVEYVKEALKWLIDDGVVGSLSIDYQIIYPSRLYLTVTYQKPNSPSRTLKFSKIWEV